MIDGADIVRDVRLSVPAQALARGVFQIEQIYIGDLRFESHADWELIAAVAVENKRHAKP